VENTKEINGWGSVGALAGVIFGLAAVLL